MEYIEIGDTGVRASRVGLGAWAIGGWMWGGTEEREAIATIHSALDRGITLVDTAAVYGYGNSEEIVGKALAVRTPRESRSSQRSVTLDWTDDGKVFRNAAKARIEKEIVDSLRRLQTDYIDIYQVHWPDPLTPIEETAAAMKALLDAGKIRAIGVSNYSAAQMEVVSLRCAAAHLAAAATISSSATPRREVLAVLRQARHRRDDLRRAVPRTAQRAGHARAGLHRRRSARPRSRNIQEPRFSQYLDAVEALDALARRALRQTGDRSCRALAARTAGRRHRAVGRAQTGAARRRRRRDGVLARSRDAR